MYNNDYQELYHHGILGQKWGVRRYQNADGTLTAAGRKHYNKVSNNDAEARKERTKKIVIAGSIAAASALALYGGYKYADYKSADLRASADVAKRYISYLSTEDGADAVHIRDIKLIKDNLTREEAYTEAQNHKTKRINAAKNFADEKYAKSFNEYKGNQSINDISKTLKNASGIKSSNREAINKATERYNNNGFLTKEDVDRQFDYADRINKIAKETGKINLDVLKEERKKER